MAALATIGTILSIAGGLKGLFGKPDDPYAERRKLMKEQMGKLEGFKDKRAAALSSRAAVERLNAIRDLTNRAAAAGIPRAQVLQLQNRLVRENQESLLQGLAGLSGQELTALQASGQLAGLLPPKPEDKSTEDLISTGVGLLTSLEGLKGEKTVTPGLSLSTDPSGSIEGITGDVAIPAPVRDLEIEADILSPEEKYQTIQKQLSTVGNLGEIGATPKFGKTTVPTIDIDFSKFDFNIEDLLRKRGGLFGSGSLLPDKKLIGIRG